MTRPFTRFAVIGLSASAALAACSGNTKMTPSPNPSATATATATATSGGSVPGGGLGGSTDIAYVPAAAAGKASPVFIYNFATQAFATTPIVDLSAISDFTAVAISADASTLYVDRPTATNATTYGTTAYAVSSTGATAEGTQTSSIYDSDVIVPQPNGNVYVYNGQGGQAPATVTVYGKALDVVMSPTTAANFGGAALEWSVPDPANGNQYSTDVDGNFYVTNDGSLLGELTQVVSSSVDLPNGGDSQSIVAPGGSTVFIVGNGLGNTVTSISIANPSGPVVANSVTLVDTNVDALLYSKTTSKLYAVTHTIANNGVETYHLTTVDPATLNASTPITLSGTTTNLKGFALSTDGANLAATTSSPASPGMLYVFSTSSGSAARTSNLPSDQGATSSTAQNLVAI